MGERKKNSSLWNVPYVKKKAAEEKVADATELLLKQRFSEKSKLHRFLLFTPDISQQRHVWYLQFASLPLHWSYEANVANK